MSNRNIDAGNVEVILGDNVAKSVTVEAGEEMVLDVEAPYYSGGGSVPVISVDATSLPAGSDATATITGNPATPLITFGIPRGADGADGSDGADGAPGKDGITPNISITVSGLPAGQSPTVTKGGTIAEPTFAIGIPAGEKGDQGSRGFYFTPAVDAAGNLSWTNDGGLTTPQRSTSKARRETRAQTALTVRMVRMARTRRLREPRPRWIAVSAFRPLR